MYAQNNFFITSNKMQKKKQTCNILYCFLRIAVIAGIIILFLPGLNPARITTLINRNLSLFTTGVSYGQLTTGLGKAFRKGGWTIISRYLLTLTLWYTLYCR